MSETTFADNLTELKESVDLEAFGADKAEVVGSPSLGDVCRQGDIYLICIDKMPKGKVSKDRQLAPDPPVPL